MRMAKFQSQIRLFCGNWEWIMPKAKAFGFQIFGGVQSFSFGIF
ncbi:hypothetical protein BGP_5145 [Beggiatoa sp. PS]|nr:hypothetical protein BGP_5145 [Beggiatoa sp. PS]